MSLPVCYCGHGLRDHIGAHTECAKCLCQSAKRDDSVPPPVSKECPRCEGSGEEWSAQDDFERKYDKARSEHDFIRTCLLCSGVGLLNEKVDTSGYDQTTV